MLHKEMKHLRVTLAIVMAHQVQAPCPYNVLNSPCLLQLAQAQIWKLSSSHSSWQAAAASCSREGLAPEIRITEAVEHHVTHTSGSLSSRTSIQLAALRAPGKP